MPGDDGGSTGGGRVTANAMCAEVLPVPKPRMTRRDKWERRPCVMRYRAFRDELIAKKKEARFRPGSAMEIVLRIPMPPSWSKKKRGEMFLLPHQQKPDIDNLVKSVLDSFYDDDSTVFEIRAKKIWAESPAIVIKNLPGGES